MRPGARWVVKGATVVGCVGVPLLGAAACSLFLNADDLSSDGPNGNGDEAGAPPAGDASQPAPDGPLGASYCASVVGLFCADFETASSVSQGFSDGSYGNSGVGSFLTASGGKSAGRVFDVVAPQTGGNATDFTLFHRVKAAVPVEVVLDVDFRVVGSFSGRTKVSALILTAGNDTNAITYLWEIDPVEGDTDIFYRVHKNGNQMSTGYTDPSLPPLAVGTWTHLRFSFDNPQRKLTIRYDDQDVGSLDLHAQMGSTLDPQIQVHVGAIFIGDASASWNMQYDNVWLH